MEPMTRASGSHLFVAFLLTACQAVAQNDPTCQEWQTRFQQVRATWQADATRRSELERSFGVPARADANGPCTVLHYAATGCSAGFTVCSTATVVSKTFTVGAMTMPVFLTTDPVALAASIAALQQSLREAQQRMAGMQEAIDALAPPPLSVSTVRPPPPAPKPTAAQRPAARQCAGITRQGLRCSRNAADGSQYCWQHRQ